MKYIFKIVLFFPIILFSQNARPEFVGDIKFDEKTDRKDFYLCNEGDIFQYFNNSEGAIIDFENFLKLTNKVQRERLIK